MSKRRKIIAQVSEHCAVSRACHAISTPRSSYYYCPKARDDSELREAIEEIALKYPRYGYRRVTEQLKRKGIHANHKKVLRIMRETSLLVQIKRYTQATTNSKHGWRRYPNLVRDVPITRPDQMWSADITYIRLRRGFVYLAVVLDVYTRSIRGWALGQDLTQRLVMDALRDGLKSATPEIHHSDQGIQYCSHAYTGLLKEHNTAISMSAAGRPTQNAYVERWFRTLKEEEVSISDYRNFAEAKDSIGYFILQVYNQERIHSSLGYLTPSEFESLYTETLPEDQMAAVAVGCPPLA